MKNETVKTNKAVKIFETRKIQFFHLLEHPSIHFIVGLS